MRKIDDNAGKALLLLAYMATLVLILLLCGCSCPRKAVDTVRSDSLRAAVRYERVFVRDTVYIEIPAQAAERTTPDSASHLENDFAESDARVNSDGTLYHDLRTKPQKRPAPIEKETVRRDSVVYVAKETKVPVPVERGLTFRERVSVKYFPHLLCAVVAVLLWICRRPLAALVRRLA